MDAAATEKGKKSNLEKNAQTKEKGLKIVKTERKLAECVCVLCYGYIVYVGQRLLYVYFCHTYFIYFSCFIHTQHGNGNRGILHKDKL